ncbi:unnamed protein product [Ambrosiozyma monospora]|uniref:Unnamed protein product n=1 Tax=Ambrosiozyma monospora TaxID=43982 RepID=A0ACB5SYV4_AMBMO|nr:unnamed protein product [Ambrosiozyma monospora]
MTNDVVSLIYPSKKLNEKLLTRPTIVHHLAIQLDCVLQYAWFLQHNFVIMVKAGAMYVYTAGSNSDVPFLEIALHSGQAIVLRREWLIINQLHVDEIADLNSSKIYFNSS